MKRLNKQGDSYLIRVTKNGLTVHSSRTRKLGKFSRLIQAEQFQEPGIEVYIRVFSGKCLDNFGDMTDLVNEGSYSSRDRLLLAYQSFLEEGR